MTGPALTTAAISESGAPTTTRPPMHDLVGTADLFMITLDTLRYDVAQAEHAAGRTPHLSALIGPDGWQRRHTPASFTYAAHHAFFAGFLPTPADDPQADRLMAVAFPGSETTGSGTWTTEAATVVDGLAHLGYRTVCVGGVGFFNPATPLGAVLTGPFQTVHWSTATSVTDPASFDHQLDWLGREVWPTLGADPVFCFVDVAALHQPNRHYLPGAASSPDDTGDTLDSHAAALRHVDAQIPRLLELIMVRPRPALLLIMSDHGTCYGEDGYTGHRLAHEITWTVPYAEVWLP